MVRRTRARRKTVLNRKFKSKSSFARRRPRTPTGRRKMKKNVKTKMCS